MLEDLNSGLVLARGSVAYGPPATPSGETGPEVEAQAKADLLPKIQKIAGAGVTADDVHVFMGRIANTKLISFGGQFNRKGLGELAKLYIGRPVMFEHDYDQPQIGKFFDSKLEYVDDPKDTREENWWATVWGYLPANDQQGDAIYRRIKLKIFDEMSAAWGFIGMPCSICDSDMRRCGHWPLEVYNPGGIAKFGMEGVVAVYEGSIVFAGAAQGTNMTPVSASSAPRGATAFAAWRANLTSRFGSVHTVDEIVTAMKAGSAPDDVMGGSLEALMASHTAAREDVPAEPVRNRIISVSCPKARFENQDDAIAWCNWRSFRTDQANATSDAWIYTQHERADFENGGDVEIALERKRSDACKAVVGRKKMSGGSAYARESDEGLGSLASLFSGA